MRILTRPQVYLVAKQSLVHRGFSQFLEDNDLEWPTPAPDSDADQIAEIAGRTCYMSYGSKSGSKTNEAYIANLLGRQDDNSFRAGPSHGSVIEHQDFSFIVTGASRGWSHEQVRHRVGFAYSQLSTRYCDYELEDTQEGDWEPAYVIPPLGQLSKETRTEFEKSYNIARHNYIKLLHMIEFDLQANKDFILELEKIPAKERKRYIRKAARGAAREVLPNGTEAIMFMTANARSLWNTIVLRASAEADAVIREVYVQIAKIMEKEMPNTFKGIRYEKIWDGSEIVVMPRDKV